MGDIADMMIDGTLDYITGEYIGEGSGYPRTMDDLKIRTTGSKIRGVTKYLTKKGINDHKGVIDGYCKNVWGASKTQMKGNLGSKCALIQQNFGKFANYVNTLKQKQ